jgi:hypothetical protein
MHALRLPPRHVLRAGLLALLLAFAFALMAAGLQGAESLSLSGSGSSGATPAPEATTPSGPPTWVTSPLTPPTAGLTR